MQKNLWKKEKLVLVKAILQKSSILVININI